MTQIPAMVALQHGAGGIAAWLIAFLELARGTGGTATTLGVVSGLLGLIIGTATFSGSMIAGGKLAGLMKQQPVVLRFHSQLLAGCSFAVLLLAGIAGMGEPQALVVYLLILTGLSILLGLLFSIRIGGAGHACADFLPECHRGPGSRLLRYCASEPLAHRLRSHRGRLRIDADPRDVRSDEERVEQGLHGQRVEA